MAAIFKGPQRRIPEMVNLPLAGAYQAGLVVTSNGTTLTQAASATGNPLILGREMMAADSDINTAYTSGDTGFAYQPVPGDTYNIRAAAATYTIGQELTINASGQVAAAASTNIVIAVSAEAGAKSAANLLAATIVSRYVKA